MRQRHLGLSSYLCLRLLHLWKASPKFQDPDFLPRYLPFRYSTAPLPPRGACRPVTHIEKLSAVWRFMSWASWFVACTETYCCVSCSCLKMCDCYPLLCPAQSLTTVRACRRCPSTEGSVSTAFLYLKNEGLNSIHFQNMRRMLGFKFSQGRTAVRSTMFA